MRPLSDHWAKPSLPILDEPLVLKLVQTLAEQGVDAVIVNTHAHTESLLAALAAAPLPQLRLLLLLGRVSHDLETVSEKRGTRAPWFGFTEPV